MGKFLCALSILLVIPLFCAFSPTELTIDFGAEKFVITEKVLQGGWYNYDSKIALTKDRNIFTRAMEMQETDRFEDTFPDIVNFVNRIAPRFEIASYDGTVNFFPDKPEKFTVTNQSSGKIIDRERLYIDILAALRGNRFPLIKTEYISIAPTPPKDIISAIVKRSEYSTRFEKNPAREHNIALAISKFNGLKVHAGEEVSFNSVVGARTESRGFQQAKIIINGEYVDGIGGGVCQASTTMFNAVVMAGLHITESHNHSLRSSYVPMGMDAMVSSGSDLRFVNNTGGTIYFQTYVKDNNVYVNIYGRTKGKDISYSLSTATTKELPPTDEFVDGTDESTLKDFKAHPELYTKELVQKGEKGCVVTTYIETYKGSRLLSRKVLRRSTYKAKPNKYKITTKSTYPQINPDTQPNLGTFPS